MSIKSFRFKISATCILGMILVALCTSIIYEKGVTMQKHGIEETLLINTYQISDGIGNSFKTRYFEVQKIANNSILFASTPEQINRQLNTYVHLQKDFDLIIFTDPNGNYVASNTMDSNNSQYQTLTP